MFKICNQSERIIVDLCRHAVRPIASMCRCKKLRKHLHEDAIKSCLLFNILIKKILLSINIFHKSQHIFSYTGNNSLCTLFNYVHLTLVQSDLEWKVTQSGSDIHGLFTIRC